MAKLIKGIEKVQKIKKWQRLENVVIYAQLLERLVETHNVPEDEAMDILNTAHITTTQDEQGLS